MDEIKSLSYSMIFEVLAVLSRGPLAMAKISNVCKVQPIYLHSLLTSAMSCGLIEQRSNEFLLTKKGARTAIYILIVSDGMNYNSGDYRALMRAFDQALESDAQV